ncbi:hypothetical protein ACG7TL_001065 [Trametes sanguinea]
MASPAGRAGAPTRSHVKLTAQCTSRGAREEGQGSRAAACICRPAQAGLSTAAFIFLAGGAQRFTLGVANELGSGPGELERAARSEGELRQRVLESNSSVARDGAQANASTRRVSVAFGQPTPPPSTVFSATLGDLRPQPEVQNIHELQADRSQSMSLRAQPPSCVLLIGSSPGDMYASDMEDSTRAPPRHEQATKPPISRLPTSRPPLVPALQRARSTIGDVEVAGQMRTV